MLLEHQGNRAAESGLSSGIRGNYSGSRVRETPALNHPFNDRSDSIPHAGHFADDHDDLRRQPRNKLSYARPKVVGHLIDRFDCPRIALAGKAQDVIKSGHRLRCSCSGPSGPAR